MRQRCAFLLLTLVGLSAPDARAACESGLAERMHARMHPHRTLDRELAACRPWPAHPGRSIVVLPLVHATGTAGRTLDLEVVIIQRPDNGNTERDTVLARLFQSEALEEDTIRIQDIRIDTARYGLSPEARAFGLRVRYTGTSRAAPYASETLRLYLPRDGTLRQVLDEVEIDRDSGEWDTRCNGRFDQLRTLLSVSPRRAGGMADLTLWRTLTQSRAQSQDDGHCNEKALAPQYSSVVLQFDGERYPLPRSLRGTP